MFLFEPAIRKRRPHDGVERYPRHEMVAKIVITLAVATLMMIGIIAVGRSIGGLFVALVIVTYGLAVHFAIYQVLMSVHTIIIRADQFIEFHFPLERHSRRLPIGNIMVIYRPSLLEDFFRRKRRYYRLGYTYVIHTDGIIPLGMIEEFYGYKDMLRSLKQLNPGITIYGIKI